VRNKRTQSDQTMSGQGSGTKMKFLREIATIKDNTFSKTNLEFQCSNYRYMRSWNSFIEIHHICSPIFNKLPIFFYYKITDIIQSIDLRLFR
jgi:hypothetical protein